MTGSSVQMPEGGTLSPPGAGHPHVWVIDMTEPRFDELADGRLASERDRGRAALLTDPAAGRALLGRRAVLRIVLARYLACSVPEVRIVTAPGGKPVLLPLPNRGSGSTQEINGAEPSKSLAFSEGYSGNLYCLAIGAGTSIGCDIEQLRSVPRARTIASRWFGRAETEALARVPDEHLEVAFMELWTGKEALAKRHGAGLRLMVGRGDEREVGVDLDVRGEFEARRLRLFSPAEGYSAAVASSEVVNEVEVIRWETQDWAAGILGAES